MERLACWMRCRTYLQHEAALCHENFPPTQYSAATCGEHVKTVGRALHFRNTKKQM